MPPTDESDRDLVARLNDAFATAAGWSYDHRWVVVGVCLAILAGSIHAASSIRMDNSYEAYFDEDDRTYLAYEEYREDFGSDEVAYLGFELPGKEHGLFDLESMRKLAHLTEALEDEVPFVYEVTTLANAELTLGSADGIEVSKLIDEMPETQAALLALRDRYLAKPMLVGGILNETADFGGIIIEMDRSSTDPPEEIVWDPALGNALENLYPQVSDAKIVEILGRPEYQDFRFVVSGDVPLNAYFNRVFEVEPLVMMLIGLLLISTILWFSFRSWVSVLTPTLVLILTVASTIGFIALLGWDIMGLSFSTTPTILMAIGVAHSVHILCEFRTQWRMRRDRREALVETIRLVGTPCLITSLTTAMGFAAMSSAPIRSLSESGLYNAFGVLAAFVLSLTLLLALLSFGRREGRPLVDAPEGRATVRALAPSRLQKLLRGISELSIRRRRTLLAGFFGFTAMCIAGAMQVQVDSNWLNDFWPSDPFRQDTIRLDEEMGGTTNIIYLFDAGEADAVKEPAVLREIDRVATAAAEHGHLVRKSYSLVDIVKDLNQAFHDGDPAYYRIPESRELIAQYLLLYETSGGEEAEEYVSSDYRKANLELRLKIAPTSQTKALVESIAARLEAEPLEATTVSLTGIGALWVKLMDYIVEGQQRGFAIAFGVITLMMIVVFRSVKIGLISMVPNLAPALLALGAMGWLGIALDYSKMMIAAIAIGISVDDTIHLMTRFQHEFRRHGNYETALREAMDDVGQALMITSVALMLCFMVFTASAFQSQAQYGWLLSASIVIALVADFFFMPALVLTWKPFGPEGAGRAASTQETLREAA